jgi:hypothetical protein
MEEDTDYYIVEKIIDKKRAKNKKDQWLYFVKWDGFPED